MKRTDIVFDRDPSAGKPLFCPYCQLTNPPDATQCDCGYVFTEKDRKNKCPMCNRYSDVNVKECICGYIFQEKDYTPKISLKRYYLTAAEIILFCIILSYFNLMAVYFILSLISTAIIFVYSKVSSKEYPYVLHMILEAVIMVAVLLFA